MNGRKTSLRVVGSILFTISILLGMSVILVRAIPDLEASMYGFLKYGYPALRSLSCPMLMTYPDRELVKIRLENPLNQSVSWYVSAEFSTVFTISAREQTVELQPKESRVLSWEVGSENIDLHNFILARVFTSPTGGLKMNEATCGTLVLNLPFRGGPTIYYTALATSIIAGVLGILLWLLNSDMSNLAVVSQSWWMRVIMIFIFVGILASVFNFWFFGIIAIALTLLMFTAFMVRKT